MSLSAEDKTVAYVTIVSALGIALVCELDRQGYLLAIQESFKEMYARSNSLFDLNRIAREYHEMEAEAMKVKTFKQEQQFISHILQETTSLDDQQLETTSKISSVLFKSWFPNLLQVGIHNENRMTTFGQWWKTFIGFKDGVF